MAVLPYVDTMVTATVLPVLPYAMVTARALPVLLYVETVATAKDLPVCLC